MKLTSFIGTKVEHLAFQIKNDSPYSSLTYNEGTADAERLYFNWSYTPSQAYSSTMSKTLECSHGGEVVYYSPRCSGGHNATLMSIKY
jgi:hypothetical protein